MIDWSRWLPGLGTDPPEEDDPVKKALAAMSSLTSATGQAASDTTSAISSGLSSAADTARGYLPDLTPSPLPPQPGPEPAAPAPGSVIPGSDVRDRWADIGSTVSEAASAGSRALSTPLGVGPDAEPQTEEEARALLQRVRPDPFSATDRAAAGGLLPALAQVGRQADPARQYGQYQEAQGATADVIGRRATEALGGGAEPTITGTIPSAVPLVGGRSYAVSPQDVGSAVAQLGLDPMNLAGVPEAAGAGRLGRGLLEAIPGVGEALGAADLVRGAARGVSGAIRGNAERVAAADARMAAGDTAYAATLFAPDPAVHGPMEIPTRRAPGAAPAALDVSEHPTFNAAAAALRNGESTEGLPVEWTTVGVTLNNKGGQHNGDHIVQIPAYRTQGGSLIPLPWAGMGNAGTPLNSAYSKAVANLGGRKGAPVGVWTDASGVGHSFDSPQEGIYMAELDRMKAAGEIADWWQGKAGRMPEVESIPYFSTNRDKGGIKKYEPDFFVKNQPTPEHPDGLVEVWEAKPASAIATAEEYGKKAGVTTGQMGWDVTKKAAGVLAQLADAGVAYRLKLQRDSSRILGEFSQRAGAPTTKDWASVPGFDPRDLPSLVKRGLSPQLGKPGTQLYVANETADLIGATSDQLIGRARELRAQGVPTAERMRILTREGRDALLPTADDLGRVAGQTRNMEVTGLADVTPYGIQHRGPLTRDELAALHPDGARVLDELQQHGSTLGRVSIDEMDLLDGTTAPHLVFTAHGDPQAAQRAAAQLGQASGTRSGVRYADAEGPVHVADLAVHGDRLLPSDFDAVRVALSEHGADAPQLIPRYNSDGTLEGMHVFGHRPDGTPLSEQQLADGLASIERTIAARGGGVQFGAAGRAEITDFGGLRGERGHAASQPAAIERSEQILGLRPTPYPDRELGGGGAGDAGASAGGAAAGPDGGAGLGRAPDHELTGFDPDDFTSDEDLAGVSLFGPTGRTRGLPLGTRVATEAGRAIVGGMAGATYAQATGDQDNLGRDVAVGAGAALVGPRAVRALQGARRAPGMLGTAGLVPDPDQIADLARRAAETPMTAPHTNGEHVTRNVARQIDKQVERGVPPDHPTGPMPPPDPPPSWWDHAENWRYNLGLLSQISTGMVQAAGGLVEAIGGGSAEAVRLAVLRGQPEALPIILGEGIKAIPGGVASSLRTVAGQVPKALEAGSDYRPALGARERAAGHPVRGAAADIIGTPGRTVTQAPDAFWYELFYRTGIAQAAADAARRELGGAPVRGIIGGVAGGTAGYETAPEEASTGERMARTLGGAVLGSAAALGPGTLERARLTRELIAHPTPAIEAEAARLAQDATYKGEAGAILGAPKAAGKAIAAGIPSEPARKALGAVGSFLMPFYNTIARIHERALEYTPGVGLAPLEKVGLAAEGRSRPMDRRLAQQAVGTALVSSGLAYAANGGIRGPGPSNPNEAQAMRDQGYTPNSTNVAGYWVPNSWFGPWGPILNEVGAINDARLYDHGDKAWDDLSGSEKADALVKMSARAVKDYPALQAASTITQLFTRPTDALTSFVGQVGAQYVPGIVRTEAARADPLARTRTRGEEVGPVQKIEESFRLGSGIGRQTLPAAQDILGREVANPRQGLAAYLPRVGLDRPDPVIQAYQDARLQIGDPPTVLSVGSLRPGLAPPELTAEEQRRWNTIRGQQLITSVGSLMEGEPWRTHDAAWRKAALEARRTAAGEFATGTLRKELGEPEVRRRMEAAGQRAARAS